MEKALAVVLQEIEQSNKPMIIAIDGRCASGKTTFAAALEKKIGCTVIHTDHFFLRPEQRTEKRLNEAGGNIDYERLTEEVMLPLLKGPPFFYRKFDCKAMKLSAEIEVIPGSVNLIEGSYSCHQKLFDFYDLRIFFTVDPQEQLRRIQLRNGSSAVSDFIERWIPMEEKYFSAYKIQEKCDFVFQI